MNKILIIGHLGKDPELTYTPNGSPVAKFTVADSRRRKDRDSGEMKEETTWFNCVAWGSQAETINQHVRKGDRLYIEGRMTSREYTDKDNIQRRVFDVIVDGIEFLTPKDPSAPSHAAE